METPPTPRQTLLAREGLAALWCLALLAVGALLWPLAPVGDQGGGPGAAAAPWVFLGLQEMLRWLPAWLAGLLLPGLALGFLAALPWLSRAQGAEPPDWRRRGPGRLELLAWLTLLALAGLTLAGWLRGSS